MTDLEKVHRDYRAAFLRYLPRREEAALHVGYKLGRAAVSDGLSILDLVQVHHEVFLEVLADTRGRLDSGVHCRLGVPPRSACYLRHGASRLPATVVTPSGPPTTSGQGRAPRAAIGVEFVLRAI